MKEKKKQELRYSDSELSTIKNTFADNEEALIAIRKVFLQIPLDAIDISALNSCKTKEIKAIIRKTFLPTIEPNVPIGKNLIVDLRMNIEGVKDKLPEDAFPYFIARERLIEYIEQQLNELEGDTQIGKPIFFKDFEGIEDKTPLEIFVNHIVRNTLLAHIEINLMQLLILAGRKDETSEETIKRLKADSSK